MPVTAYIQLGIAAIQIIMQIIQDVQGGQAPQIGTNTAQFISQLGAVGKIKELQGIDTAQLVPTINDLFSTIHTFIQNQHQQTPPTA